jgi:hypothetical protein
VSDVIVSIEERGSVMYLIRLTIFQNIHLPEGVGAKVVGGNLVDRVDGVELLKIPVKDFK